MSTFEAACAPPLRMFICGTGRLLLPPDAMWAHRGPLDDALKQAIEAPNIALAPNLPLLGVPSKATKAVSMPSWSDTSIPTRIS